MSTRVTMGTARAPGRRGDVKTDRQSYCRQPERETNLFLCLNHQSPGYNHPANPTANPTQQDPRVARPGSTVDLNAHGPGMAPMVNIKPESRIPSTGAMTLAFFFGARRFTCADAVIAVIGYRGQGGRGDRSTVSWATVGPDMTTGTISCGMGRCLVVGHTGSSLAEGTSECGSVWACARGLVQARQNKTKERK